MQHNNHILCWVACGYGAFLTVLIRVSSNKGESWMAMMGFDRIILRLLIRYDREFCTSQNGFGVDPTRNKLLQET